MPVVQKFNYPKSEREFRKLQDEFYSISKDAIANGNKPSFKGLLEIIGSEVVILSAIHKIKANKGSNTPGSDGKTMKDDFLQKPADKVIKEVQNTFNNYKAESIRRVFIPKPGKKEKRPLGIPTIKDRIIQECVRSVIEPILEAQFFAHSYGFRPQRDTHMALERTKDLVHKTQYSWIIEGDISKFFDNVNHSILLRKLWNMGIRDRRILMIIKQMLKAGIMEETIHNDIGTPQGGIISPLLANVYLHKFDEWVTREWEQKKTQHRYSANNNMYKALRKSSRLKPAYLVRYADDWILITDTKSNAEKWRKRIKSYLQTNLKLSLSEEKTSITNVRKKSIKFVGFNFKVIRGSSPTGWISRTSVDNEKLLGKFETIRKDIRRLRKLPRKEDVIHGINLINLKIRGLIQYYQPANTVYLSMHKTGKGILQLAQRTFINLRMDYKWVPADKTDNLLSVHSQYKTQIPAIEYRGLQIGVTSPMFAKWTMPPLKNQLETPYSEQGRELYRKRSKKKSPLARSDDILSINQSELISWKFKDTKYNFEFYLNRAYAFNRDKGKCRICGNDITSPADVHTHHVRPYLPIYSVNKVEHLATVHPICHERIHDGVEYSNLGTKQWKKIKDFREKLSSK